MYIGIFIIEFVNIYSMNLQHVMYSTSLFMYLFDRHNQFLISTVLSIFMVGCNINFYVIFIHVDLFYRKHLLSYELLH